MLIHNITAYGVLLTDEVSGPTNPPQTQLRIDNNKAWTIQNFFVSSVTDKDQGSLSSILFIPSCSHIDNNIMVQ